MVYNISALHMGSWKEVCIVNTKLSLISPMRVKNSGGLMGKCVPFLSHRVHLKGRRGGGDGEGKRNESELFRVRDCNFHATHVS